MITPLGKLLLISVAVFVAFVVVATWDAPAQLAPTMSNVATSGDSATAFFPAGTIEHERGGLEADVSAYAGFVQITGGATSAVAQTSIPGADHIDALTEIAAALKSGADATLVTGTAGTSGNFASWNADGDLVDSAVTVAGVYGNLYEDDLGGATVDITVTTAGTYYGWVSATAGAVSGVTADVTVTAGEPGDSLTVPAGNYLAAFGASFSGTGGAVMSCCIHDDNARTAACMERTLGVAGSSGSGATGLAILSGVGASSVLDVRCTSDDNGDTIAIKSAQLFVQKL